MPDREHEGDSRPTPDPTILTTSAISRAVQSERDYVDSQLEVLRERLRGIDRATALLDAQVNRFPTVMDREIGHMREAMDIRFAAVGEQFKERDVRVEAALAAQKELVGRQDESNAKAIAKSETATTDTITKLAELRASETKGVTDKIEATNERVGRLETRVTTNESLKVGGKEQLTAIYALVAFLVTVLILGTMLAANGVFTN